MNAYFTSGAALARNRLAVVVVSPFAQVARDPRRAVAASEMRKRRRHERVELGLGQCPRAWLDALAPDVESTVRYAEYARH